MSLKPLKRSTKVEKDRKTPKKNKNTFENV